MIGLVMMIRAKVRKEWGCVAEWQPASRELLAKKASWAYPVSRRYYELLDACARTVGAKP